MTTGVCGTCGAPIDLSPWTRLILHHEADGGLCPGSGKTMVTKPTEDLEDVVLGSLWVCTALPSVVFKASAVETTDDVPIAVTLTRPPSQSQYRTRRASVDVLTRDYRLGQVLAPQTMKP